MTPKPGNAMTASMMDDAPLNPALLPAGFSDLLPPEAEAEADGIEAIMAVFGAHGYERIRPPLMEFEASLLNGSGAAVSEQAFRLMDPDTRRMMAVRPDITPQIARIASTRLAEAPRPLRVSYAGPCILVSGAGRESARQISQAGIELIGPDSPEADAEIVAVAAEALERLGAGRVSFDLTMPPLVPALLADHPFDPATRRALMHALDRKDAAAVAEHGGTMAPVLIELLHAAGPAARALDALRDADLPPAARTLSDRLTATVAAVEARVPGIRLTVDPVEFRGWHYHTGVCVTIYAVGGREELGRGGRYLSNDSEPACGVTLRPDILLRVAAPRPGRERVFVPVDADRAQAATLRADGYATVGALAPVSDPVAEARRLGCGFVLQEGTLTALD